MEEELKYIIESLLFVSEGPLTLDRLKKVLEIEDAKEIRQALESLSEEYETRGGGFNLREVANGYQIRTRPEYAKWIKRMVQPGSQRLSKAALETLAIVAYKQPVIRADIEFVRGVDCGGVLRMLLEKKLVRVLGRKEIPGRPMIYATTKQFLEIFDLKDLKELPSPKEIEALGNTHILDTESDTETVSEAIGGEIPDDLETKEDRVTEEDIRGDLETNEDKISEEMLLENDNESKYLDIYIETTEPAPPEILDFDEDIEQKEQEPDILENPPSEEDDPDLHKKDQTD